MGEGKPPSIDDAEIDREVARGQVLADAIEKAGEQHDAERAKAAELLEPFIAQAMRAIATHEFMIAAELFDRVADEYRLRGLRGDADQWNHRAADCRSAARHAKRLAKKGKGR